MTFVLVRRLQHGKQASAQEPWRALLEIDDPNRAVRLAEKLQRIRLGPDQEWEAGVVDESAMKPAEIAQRKSEIARGGLYSYFGRDGRA